MKLFEVAEKVQDSGEYILGSRETGSHACYLVYGALKPGEKGRELRPGHGHEEIVLAMIGDLRLKGLYRNAQTGAGAASHRRGVRYCGEHG